jgi:hypothetical protein
MRSGLVVQEATRVALNPKHELRMAEDGDWASSRLRISLFWISSLAQVSMTREAESATA